MTTSVPGSHTLSRLALLALLVFLMATVFTAVTGAHVALAQSGDVTLVNADREFAERKKDGEFIARPIFNKRLDFLYYGLRDAKTGDWMTGLYRVQGGEKELDSGWEYSIEYPALDEQPDLDPERVYVLAIVAPDPDGADPGNFNTLVPPYQPTGLWDRVLRAFNPETWARAILTWVLEGVHGALCVVVEKITGDDVTNCQEV